MFLISARFRASRSKNAVRQGVVFFRITERRNGGSVVDRDVNSDISGSDAGVLQRERTAIIARLRMLYCIVERRADSGLPFEADDVVADFRLALSGDASMAGVVAKASTDFPLRDDLVSIGREFKGDFKFVLTQHERGTTQQSTLPEFIFSLSQTMKAEGRVSRSRSFLSLLSNLRDFQGDDTLTFGHFGAEFVHNYALWLKRADIAPSTQSFYLRTLRAVLNKAQANGLIENTSEWFEGVNTKIYHSANEDTNSVLDRSTLLKIERADFHAHGQLALVRDMFMFGFYCGGMELVDIVNLTDSNIVGNVLVYKRRQKGQTKKALLGDEALKIIDRYRRPQSKHIFPLLEQSPGVLFETARNYVYQSIKAIGQTIGLPSLTFSMNIGAYNSMAAGINISEMMLRNCPAV